MEAQNGRVSRNDTTITWQSTGQGSQTRQGDDITMILKRSKFFRTSPDNHIANNPYKVLFGQGDYTCSVADFTGTMKGPMKGADGKMIPPTNKKFQVEFCTVAMWKKWRDCRRKAIL